MCVACCSHGSENASHATIFSVDLNGTVQNDMGDSWCHWFIKTGWSVKGRNSSTELPIAIKLSLTV